MKVKISVHSAIQETLRAGFDPLKTLEIAEQEQEREIRLLTVRAIQKTVYQNGTDILGLMKAVRKYEPDYYRSHSGELEKLLQDMRFDIQIACNISRTGLEAEEDKR